MLTKSAFQQKGRCPSAAPRQGTSRTALRPGGAALASSPRAEEPPREALCGVSVLPLVVRRQGVATVAIAASLSLPLQRVRDRHQGQLPPRAPFPRPVPRLPPLVPPLPSRPVGCDTAASDTAADHSGCAPAPGRVVGSLERRRCCQAVQRTGEAHP